MWRILSATTAKSQTSRCPTQTAKPKAALSRGTKRKVSVYSDSEEDAYSDDDESDYTDDIGKKGMKKNNSVEVTVTTVKKPSVAKNTAAPKEAGRPSTKVRKAATAAKAKAKSTIQKPAAKKSPAVTSPAKRLAVASPAKRNAPLGSLLSSPTKAQAVRPKLTMGSSSSSLSSSSLLSHTNQTPATRQKLGRGTGRSGGASLRDLLAGSHAPRAGLSRRVRK
ncbi:hypothetical protein FBU59_002903 [Linderina macrospora]|uniref:Uncharacterized protein n=1 Tax=Linderina macrospora TaxID=4868 RepID=A0ACC1JA60_9FUNG|nr:hypothetical protein FBU59_002903 [Linderina macrospora]